MREKVLLELAIGSAEEDVDNGVVMTSGKVDGEENTGMDGGRSCLKRLNWRTCEFLEI